MHIIIKHFIILFSNRLQLKNCKKKVIKKRKLFNFLKKFKILPKFYFY